jgi:hypothetical protein
LFETGDLDLREEEHSAASSWPTTISMKERMIRAMKIFISAGAIAEMSGSIMKPPRKKRRRRKISSR